MGTGPDQTTVGMQWASVTTLSAILVIMYFVCSTFVACVAIFHSKDSAAALPYIQGWSNFFDGWLKLIVSLVVLILDRIGLWEAVRIRIMHWANNVGKTLEVEKASIAKNLN
ncbi:MAG: hypothetical protein JSS89_12015 [Bacteroidetes bacterium]|nr:hypothetical protein [Bacteroidota bacterium]